MLRVLKCLAWVITVHFTIHCSVFADNLSFEDFVNPPSPYLPKTWMHAMNGNMSKPGFTEDFQAMREAGIGGAIFFHVHRRNWPYSSRGPVRFNTDEFFEHLLHAAKQADENNIEFGIHNADGWTSSGGPWVTPEMSMKRVTWSELTVEGGNRVFPPQPGFAEGLYEDVAVIAVPTTQFNRNNDFLDATLRTSEEREDAAVLKDADWDTELTFTKNDTEEYWVEVALAQPATLRSLQIETPNRHGEASLQVSSDGINYTTVVEKLRRPRTGARMWTFSPQLVSDEQDGYTATFFRIVFDKPITLKRFDLWSEPRIDDWLSMNSMERGRLHMAPRIHPDAIIKQEDILVLNRGEIPQQGVYVPDGSWRLLRFGYTSTGAFNVPATVEGEGLEVDKFDAAALEYHFEQYVGKLAKMAKERGIESLRTTEIDSYEVGGQNWTRDIERSFSDKFGYDFIPWLPLMTGRVIESGEHTGAILQEFRQHLSDLMVENYFGEFTRLSRKYGLESYIEPYGWGPFDELASGGQADRLMGEFWVRDQVYNGRVMAAISSGHIYGKPIISAESFTSIRTVNWYGHPYFYKHYGDKMWARGINETMFHRFAHQPNNHVKPGMTMDSIGSHIDRTQTWWSNGGVAWFDYLARGAYLLQQGVPDADFLIHLGDRAPLRVGNGNNTGVPDGYGYDYTNTDVLLNRVTVKDGWLTLPEGTRYKALHLVSTDYMHLKTLKRIKALVEEGATVIGEKPQRVIGFSEWSAQAEFSRIADELWGAGNETQPIVLNYKKGRVSSFSLIESIEHLGFEPDLKIDQVPAKFFAHRRIGQNDLYYFYNDQPVFRKLTVDLRQGDGVPEIWNIDDGSIESLPNYLRNKNRLVTELALEPYAGRFVLIRRDSNTPTFDGTHSQLVSAIYENDATTQTILNLDGPWKVVFNPVRGGPGQVVMSELTDWTTHNNKDIKHYSGTATYHRNLTVTAEQLQSGQPLYLDLGDVQQIAEVAVNGQSIATLWKPPFAVDISQAVRIGENKLSIEITNTWVNRLIGDEALPDTSGYQMTGDTVPWINANEPPPESQRLTFTGYNFFEKQPKTLQPAGLLGPVRLIYEG
ncbi:glycosyl hydrolase [Alteromonas sp. KUL49]|uniref:glycosyl hydrolase n=1 Tax=Alteromonas sp. KUL49 TaxID=2480798 RepID=UPI00102F094B|nr:glycosyl hydrolase [Alteromonas sp. KUL49]TAP37311.1 glycoside hydrolase [Alteromonas sp. KUL49]GEA12932.1 hypothetical protein KUL49_33070 [Alteromonas sp. KUL49]